MRSKTFRRKNRKMSRRRRAGQPENLGRTTTAETIAMKEGITSKPSVASRPMMGRSTSAEMSQMEEGYAPTAPPMSMMNEMGAMGRTTTAELNAMETGSVDIESGFGAGKGGKKRRKRRKSRKTRKSRKGGKRRKSHRR